MNSTVLKYVAAIICVSACIAAGASTTAKPATVVFVGDSITEYWSRAGLFFPGKPYVNRGVHGLTTAQMLTRFQADVVDLHPAVVVILGGTNDIAGIADDSFVGTEANLRSMAELAKAHHIRVVLSSVLPAAEKAWGMGVHPGPKIRTLNTWIAQYCHDQNIGYIDYYTALASADGTPKPGLTRDGVHPTAEGYAAMAPLAQAAIDKAMDTR